MLEFGLPPAAHPTVCVHSACGGARVRLVDQKDMVEGVPPKALHAPLLLRFVDEAVRAVASGDPGNIRFYSSGGDRQTSVASPYAPPDAKPFVFIPGEAPAGA